MVTLNFLIDSTTFDRKQYFFREHLDILFAKCFHKFRITVENYPDTNITDIPKCEPQSSEETGDFIVRVVSIERLYTSTNEHASAVTISVLNDLQPVNATYMTDIFTFIGVHSLTKQLELTYYTGKVFENPQNKAWYEGKMKWIVVGLSGRLIVY